MSALPPQVQPVAPVELSKACRLLNHGPTVLVSARHGETVDVMAAAWACVLDFTPPKMSVVLDKATRTRELVEQSGFFVLQVPTVAQLPLVQQLGTTSLHQLPDKLLRAGVQWLPDLNACCPPVTGAHGEPVPPQAIVPSPACPSAPAWPLVAGCSAWLACRLLVEPHNQQTYDLFIGEVIGCWADARVFHRGRWHFESADPEWRSLHHVAGGHYYAVGDALQATATVASQDEQA